jgi:multidrug transporter EmrE-like cation transporter
MSKSYEEDGPVPPEARSVVLPACRTGQASGHQVTGHGEHEEEKSRRHHNLTMASLGLLLFAVISAATGQVLLKHGMQIASARAAHSHGSLAVKAVTSPWVLLGLAVFGISAIAWLAALSRIPLSVAYPFNALGYVVILTASIVVLHERANALTWAGTLLVVSGLITVVLAQS